MASGCGVVVVHERLAPRRDAVLGGLQLVQHALGCQEQVGPHHCRIGPSDHGRFREHSAWVRSGGRRWLSQVGGLERRQCWGVAYEL